MLDVVNTCVRYGWRPIVSSTVTNAWTDGTHFAVIARDNSGVYVTVNRIEVGVASAVDATRWAPLGRQRDLEPKQIIALGFDGSRSMDCTSIVASRVSDGRWFHRSVEFVGRRRSCDRLDRPRDL